MLRFIRGLPVTREEAMGAMLGWYDRERPETRCVCIIDPENTSSIRLAAKLGFERYGLANYREAKVSKYERHRHDRGRDPRS